MINYHSESLHLLLMVSFLALANSNILNESLKIKNNLFDFSAEKVFPSVTTLGYDNNHLSTARKNNQPGKPTMNKELIISNHHAADNPHMDLYEISSDPTMSPTVPVYQMYTVAGIGLTGAALNVDTASSAKLNGPYGLFVDSSGNILQITDYSGSRVRKIDLPSGIMTLVAGSGLRSSTGDNGQATIAALNYPMGLEGTTSGVVFVSEYSGNRIRKIATNGIITAYVGTGASTSTMVATSANGDGGFATSAKLNAPRAISSDSGFNLYFADQNNNKVRRVDATTQIITTVVGTGAKTTTGDGGKATSATLNFLCSVR